MILRLFLVVDCIKFDNLKLLLSIDVQSQLMVLFNSSFDSLSLENRNIIVPIINIVRKNIIFLFMIKCLKS